MNKKIFSFALYAITAMIVCCFTSCEKKVSNVITFYGTVIDAQTGEPVWNAKVSCRDYSTVTGNDGVYEFDIPFQNSLEHEFVKEFVELKVYKDGYQDPDYLGDTYHWHVCLAAELGKRIKVDFAIKRKRI